MGCSTLQYQTVIRRHSKVVTNIPSMQFTTGKCLESYMITGDFHCIGSMTVSTWVDSVMHKHQYYRILHKHQYPWMDSIMHKHQNSASLRPSPSMRHILFCILQHHPALTPHARFHLRARVALLPVLSALQVGAATAVLTIVVIGALQGQAGVAALLVHSTNAPGEK